MDLEGRLKAALADRYRIEQEIGSGGMATVYLAEDRKHERKVAVKVLNPELARDLGAERFLREIKTAANLNHPHILPLHDSGEADGFLYFVMPHVRGESLRTRLTREKQLPIGDAIRITQEIADALAYAHGEGIIHRDVKPANIMLEAGHAVLADFGVAHALAEAKDDRITRTGTSLGSPAYMSPEQAAGESDLEGRSDQYALGCVLYEMLAGHPPFSGAQAETVMRQHLTEQPPSVSQARPSVPEAVEDVLKRAMAKNPADRFRTTREMAAALGPGKTQAPSTRPAFPRTAALVGTIVGIILLAVLLIWIPGSRDEPSSGAAALGEPHTPRIAVLPFENISPDPEDAYLADGMHEEIISQLQKITGLMVISRTSVMQYRERMQPVQEIAADLAVGFLLEGSVRKEGDRVRLTAQLIDAERDEHLWANSYDRNLTVGDLFEIQADVAKRIAGALEAELTPQETARINTRLTTNLEAYEAYLRANSVRFRGYDERDFRFAIRMYQRATELDPDFCVAHARLSRSHSDMYWFTFDLSKERIQASREALERARAIDPDHPEVHIAAAYYNYHYLLDYEAALESFDQALSKQPNHPDAISGVGYIYRRLGKLEEAERHIRKAFELDPLAARIGFNLGETCLLMRSYEDADRFMERASELLPEYGRPYAYQAWLHLMIGDPAEARRILQKGIMAGADPGGDAFIPWVWISIDLFESEPESALRRIDDEGWNVLENQFFVLPRGLLVGELRSLMGDSTAALAEFRSARSYLQERLAETPNDHRLHSALGLVLAGLGHDDEAVAEGRRGAGLMSTGVDFYRALFRLEDLARIYVQVGEEDLALDIFEDLLEGSGLLTARFLELDPRLASLRDHPRFQALLEKYADGVEH